VLIRFGDAIAIAEGAIFLSPTPTDLMVEVAREKRPLQVWC
jgi:hypothetical protein